MICWRYHTPNSECPSKYKKSYILSQIALLHLVTKGKHCSERALFIRRNVIGKKAIHYTCWILAFRWEYFYLRYTTLGVKHPGLTRAAPSRTFHETKRQHSNHVFTVHLPTITTWLQLVRTFSALNLQKHQQTLRSHTFMTLRTEFQQLISHLK